VRDRLANSNVGVAFSCRGKTQQILRSLQKSARSLQSNGGFKLSRRIWGMLQKQWRPKGEGLIFKTNARSDYKQKT